MFDINRRANFKTVGELKALIENLPDDTKVCVTGDDYCWFHIEEDESVISFDTEDLEDCYLDSNLIFG